MEEFKARRKAVTYGKSSKRIPLHSIFDVKPNLQRPSSTDQGQQPDKAKARPSKKRSQPDVEGRALLGSSGGRISVSSSRALSPSSADASAEVSDSSNSQSSSHYHHESTTSSILDIISSDEEACSRQLQPSGTKRRKVTPLNRSEKQTTLTSREQQQQLKTNRPTAKNQPIAGKNKVDKVIARIQARNTKRVANDETAPSRSGRPLQAHEREPIGSTMVVDRPSNPGSTASPPFTPISNRTTPQRRRRSSSFIQLGDELRFLGSAKLDSPKLKSVSSAQHSDSGMVPSPSRLGLSSLRLTPEKKPGTKNTYRNDANMPDRVDMVSAQPRVRQRLIDRLDAPRARSQPLEANPNTGSPRKGSPYHNRSQDEDIVGSLGATKILKLDDLRSKPTYAKERSHLSDMVSDIDSLALPEVPRLLGPPLHRGNTFNKLASQLDEELYESDDPGPAGAVKSIHELRQAGMNSRFERELEAIFEDIEASHSPSKALRIQALLQLVQKIEDEEYARQFVDVGMTNRLAGCGQNDTDLISGILLGLALYAIVSIDQGSASSLTCLFGAIIRLSPVLLADSRPLSKVASDRTQNLSKALSRDLSYFSKTTTTWKFKGNLHLTPRNIGLYCLERMLRGLRETKNPSSHLPSPIFTQVLRVLDELCRSSWDSEEHTKLTEVALSALELSAISQARKNFEGDSNIEEYQLLGSVITKVIGHAKAEHPEIQCSALRLVISLTNNQTVICDALAETGLIPAVFSVVKVNLLPLAEKADKGDEFEGSKLDPVMMALGCLLNLVDCSSEARARLDLSTHGTASSIEWLVFAFNIRAGKSADATTIPQSQVCVAFGYLSMLLCTLCLDDTIRPHVIAKLDGQNLKVLIGEAGEFLDKLQLVANFNPDDPSTSAFNARFRSILVQIESLIR